MSVINQMLKDLDKRQQHNAQAMSPLVEDNGRSFRFYLLIVFALLVLVFSAWFALRYFDDFESDNQVEVLNEAATTNSGSSAQATSLEQTQALQAVAQAIDVEVSPPQNSQPSETPPAQPQTQSLQPSTAANLPQANMVAPSEQVSSEAQETALPEAVAESIEPPQTPAKVVAQSDTKISTVEEKPPVAAPETEQPLANPPIAEGELQIKPLELSVEQRVAMYKRRGFQALEQNQPSQARVEFSKALQLEHSAHEVREQLAALVYASGDLPRAVNLLEEGLQLQPLRSTFRLMLARIFVQQQQLTQALAYLEGASPEIAGHVDYYAMQAGLAQRLDRQQLALVSYQRLLRYEPRRARWWLGYAIANDKLANYAEALSAYRQAQLVGQLSANSSEFVVSRIKQLEQ
ncbi:tetratricopeptide repeat protein [Agarivorans sp.]|uniref:tetratricopeptide repeat protein n=1 Tax=Agarivorans sp. TaxID=1872412 RepID=UPI003D03FD91